MYYQKYSTYFTDSQFEIKPGAVENYRLARESHASQQTAPQATIRGSLICRLCGLHSQTHYKCIIISIILQMYNMLVVIVEAVFIVVRGTSVIVWLKWKLRTRQQYSTLVRVLVLVQYQYSTSTDQFVDKNKTRVLKSVTRIS